MAHMNTDDVLHLAKLARIELSPAEVETFTNEMSAILSYIGAVQALATDNATTVPPLGARHNIFRPDAVTNTADAYTDDILAEMPKTNGRFLEVKKILQAE